jgi:hypothetical protein
MNDNTQPAEDLSATAAPETASDQQPAQPPTQEAAETEAPAKTFTQEELDAIVAKRLAKEQRKWERQVRQPPQTPAAPPELPPADQFESVDAYAQALAEKKAHELVQKREMERQQSELLESYAEREEAARDKYEDFESVVYNPNLRITTLMAQTIQASDIGPDIAYHLGSNPKEANRIASLPPLLQAKEIGKLEAKLADNPPVVRKQTKAPDPIAPVASNRSSAPKFDTTDPRSVKEMSTSDWIEAERQRQIRKMQSRMSA